MQLQVQPNHNPVILTNMNRTYDEAIAQYAVTLTAGALKVSGQPPLTYICILVATLPAARLD